MELGPFIIPREECDHVLKLCQNNKTHIIHVVGGLGVGKTELIKQVCYNIWPMQTFYIECTEDETFVGILETISQILGCNPDGRSLQQRVFSLLINCSQSALLVLDISKVPNRPDFHHSIWKFVLKLGEANSPLKVIVTARYKDDRIRKMNLIQHVFVPCLSKEESKDLIALVDSADDCSIGSSKACSKEIDQLISYCQGTPHMLIKYYTEIKPIGISVRRKSMSILVEQLRMDLAFKLQFETYATALKIQIIKLSAIPGVFSCDIASNVLESEDVESARLIVTIIFKEQLLQREGSYFFMPSIIREFIKQLAAENNHLKTTLSGAVERVTCCYLSVLYALNAMFMALEDCCGNAILDTLLNDVETMCDCLEEDKDRCDCPIARKLLLVYRQNEMCFEWVIEHGVRGEHWRQVTDCINECVSLLAKTASLELKDSVYRYALTQSTSSKDIARRSCTLVSIVFLQMYHHNCRSDPVHSIAQLEEAEMHLNSCAGKIKDLNLEIYEVWAHCLTKLGHLIGANNKEELEKGMEKLYKALEIRHNEIRQGRGSKALIAAAYVDIASKQNFANKLFRAFEISDNA